MEKERVVTKVHLPYMFPPVFRKVGIYCRVSTNLQEQLHSMATQVSFFVKMTSSRYEWNLVDTYLDFHTGSTQAGRLEFLRMLDDCRNKKIDLILTKNVSRFGRNTEEALIALRELKDLGVEVIFQDDNLDTGRMDSELMLSIISAYAEQENTSRRDNQMWSMKKRLEDGSSEIYKRTCYGYISGEKGELRIDPGKAMVVQNIFKWYLDGYSVIGIIKELEQSFTLSPSGKDKWSKHTIEKILRNEKYVGTVTAMKTITVQHKRKKNEGEENKYVIENNHPPIITREIFDAVQEEISRRSNIEVDENGQRTRKKNKYSSKNMLI